MSLTTAKQTAPPVYQSLVERLVFNGRQLTRKYPDNGDYRVSRYLYDLRDVVAQRSQRFILAANLQPRTAYARGDRVRTSESTTLPDASSPVLDGLQADPVENPVFYRRSNTANRRRCVRESSPSPGPYGARVRDHERPCSHPGEQVRLPDRIRDSPVEGGGYPRSRAYENTMVARMLESVHQRRGNAADGATVHREQSRAGTHEATSMVLCDGEMMRQAAVLLFSSRSQSDWLDGRVVQRRSVERRSGSTTAPLNERPRR